MPQHYDLTRDDVAFMRRLALNSNTPDIRTVDFAELEKRVAANHVRAKEEKS
jgi:hypothetical protein